MILLGPHYEFTVNDAAVLIRPLDNGSFMAAITAAGLMAIGDDDEELEPVLAALGGGICELWCTEVALGHLWPGGLGIFNGQDGTTPLTTAEIKLANGLVSCVKRAKWRGHHPSNHGDGAKYERGV